MPSTLILIDAKNALYRFGFAHSSLTNSAGEPTGALYGVLRSLIQLKRRYPDGQFTVVWDGRGESWRHKFFPEYKANRRKVVSEVAVMPEVLVSVPKETMEVSSAFMRRLEKAAEKLRKTETGKISGKTANQANVAKIVAESQAALRVVPDKKQEEHDEAVRRVLAQEKPLKKLLALMQIPQIEVETVEADDLIGMAAVLHRTFNLPVVVYSSDKDFMQLMRIGVTIIRPQPFVKGGNKDRLGPETEETVRKKFGCTPEQLLQVRAYAGDKSDNIPVAVPGIGEKRALLCLAAGADPALDKIVCTDTKLAGKLRAGWGDVRRNYRLMQIAAHPDPALFGAETVKEIARVLGKAGKHLVACANYPRTLDVVDEKGGYVDFERTYRKFLLRLLDLDLMEAIEHRHFLWRIQRVR